MVSSSAGLALDLGYALDPVRWAREVVGVDLDDWQQQVLRSDARRVAVCCYRQAGKTEVVACAAGHHLVYAPGAFVVVAGPAGRQREEMKSRILATLRNVPERTAGILRNDDERGVELANGGRLLLVPDSAVTGRGFAGVTLLIVEEAAYVSDEAMSAALPYLSTRDGRLVKISTANGKRGHFYESMQDPQTERYLIPWREGAGRVSRAFVEDFRRTEGEWMYRQEYLCEFLESEAAVVSSDVLKGAIDPRFKGLDV